MANNSISLVSLDFDTLKAQLKQYLKGQAQFSDYDFDGSNMSVLLDILSYNTHLNAFYLNMVASEMFLDSAQLRNSIVSIAKALNYTPRSVKSATAILDCKFPQSGLDVFVIPKYTRFTGRNSVGTYQFVTNEAVVLYPSGGLFSIPNLAVYEGLLTTDTFVVDYSVEGQQFILQNETIDTSSVSVTVSEDGGTSFTEYLRSQDIVGLDSSSKVFFIQATSDSRYEVVFGDGAFGYKPKDGAVINVVYRSSVGSDGNGATNFTLTDNLGTINGYGSAIIPTIQVVSAGYGGAAAESIEEIKYRAPRAYQTQGRAVTADDFNIIVTQRFPNVKTAYAYDGGLAPDYPRHGAVYVVPITFSGELLSQVEKLDMQEYLRQRAAVGIDPIVIDPDYLFVNVTATVKYNSDATSLTANDIESLCKVAIETYNSSELNDFNVELSRSRLEQQINNADASIQSNQVELLLKKSISAEIDKVALPSVNFRNAIVPGTVFSSKFISAGRVYQYCDFNPNTDQLNVVFDGNKSIITTTNNTMYLADITSPSAIIYSAAGTIDYNQGVMAMNPITINSFNGSPDIVVTAKPRDADIISKLNDVIAIDTSTGITVNVRKS